MVKDIIRIHHPFLDTSTPLEVSICLFTQCNMHCDFCLQRYQKRSGLGANTIALTIQALNETYRLTDRQTINVMIYGGELFHDGIKSFDQYDTLVGAINEYSSQYNKKSNILFASNCVHTKTERVLQFLNKHNIKHLNCSYDSVGRFATENQKQTFLRNIDYYKAHGIDITIGVTLTQQNIRTIIDGDSTFDFLYHNYSIVFDYYHPINNDSPVDEKLLAEFLIFCQQHYPAILSLQSLVDSTVKHGIGCSCPAIFIVQGMVQKPCCDFAEDLKTYIKNKQCFSCSYFRSCPHKCINLMRNNVDCHLKIFFDYVHSLSKTY